ncbi:MAG: hypothetical protein U0704_12655 [Candidatus Eisenbacteria bacterium]
MIRLLLVLLLLPAVASAAPARRSASRRAPVPAVAAPQPRESGPRRLDDIHIEGEIPVPQVLFVSVREQRRFLDFDASRWLRPARALAASTPVPDVTIRVTQSVTPAKESAR